MEDGKEPPVQPTLPARPSWTTIRDILLFFAGLAGIVHETAIAATAEPTLVVLFAAMCGLPAFLRKDEGK